MQFGFTLFGNTGLNCPSITTNAGLLPWDLPSVPYRACHHTMCFFFQKGFTVLIPKGLKVKHTSMQGWGENQKIAIKNTCFWKQIISSTFIYFSSFVILFTPTCLFALACIHYLNIQKDNFCPLRYFKLLPSLKCVAFQKKKIP